MESTISIEEWIDIFTQEKVQLSSLQRLIDHEYSDPADLELLTHLATEESSRLRFGIHDSLLSYTHLSLGAEQIKSY